MKKQFEVYGAAMAQAHKALTLLNDAQEKEIAAVSEEYEELDADYEQVYRDMDNIINGFHAKWGGAMDEREKRIAAVKKKYGLMYKETMLAAGWNPDMVSEE